MKRKFLILSAALLAVCGAALLQSCSSEYEYYDETEEYGYYTEEEIEQMVEVAKCYGLDVEIDPDYYGKKLTMAEYTKDLTLFANLPGEYSLVPNNDSTEFYFVRKENAKSTRRILTRSAESGLASSGNFDFSEGLPCTVNISWYSSRKNGYVVSVTATPPYRLHGGGTSYFCSQYLSLNHTYSIYNENIRYGRYNIAGSYYPNGKKDFKVVQVQSDYEDDNNEDQSKQ